MKKEQKRKSDGLFLKCVLIIASVWIAASLVPYLIVGGTWGMVWMYVNAPLSFWTETTILAQIAYPHLFVFVTTVVNGFLIAFFLSGVWKLLCKKTKNEHTGQPIALTMPSYANE